MPFLTTQLINARSGLSEVSSSGNDYSMEHTETGSGSRKTTIRKKTELTVREELQKDVDKWLGDVV